MADDELTHLAARPAAELDAWLRAHLTRQAIAILLAPIADLSAAQRWAAGFAAYRELRLLVRGVSATPQALADTLASAAPLDPDAALIWLASGETRDWARGALRAIEAPGLRDRWLCLLAGPGATRELAHKLGYEDGLAPLVPNGEVAALLARAAVASESYRRRGSSPPCYLG
jgi:hypothetical protein